MRRLSLLLILPAGLLALVTAGMLGAAANSYGPPAHDLTWPQVVQYSAQLLWDDGLLTRPLDKTAPEQEFRVGEGESIASICDRLQAAGIVSDASMLRDYLIYTGLDTSVQAGVFRLGASMSVVDVAHAMQDATPADVAFVVLPGWRLEEIAASLPTSGLSITPDEFVAAASIPHSGFAFLSGATTMEGFLYPDSYIVPRAAETDELINALLRGFSLHLTVDLEEAFSRHGLTVYQGVTLASIVQREAVHAEEAPLIASVYLNRLQIGMRLDADPTVQYALAYNPVQLTWWKNPLSLEDFKRPSPYNTYLNDGLPPSPIANPGREALQAVASPAETPYTYFSARCDGSGFHLFAETFQEHLGNICP